MSSQSGSLSATVSFGADESSHLYRGATSPNPIGVVVRSSVDLPLSVPAHLTILLPDGESFECRALSHWTSPVAHSEYWIGLRLVNPSRDLCAALTRVAARFPTRLYDENPEARVRDDMEDSCPCTLRVPYRPKDAPSTSMSRPFAVVGSGYRVDFDELRRSGPGMKLARDGDDVVSV
ncbi:MAG: hypothetical protein QM784_01105 [Polyangiaceae bacterium]